jgi:hypothetical protein
VENFLVGEGTLTGEAGHSSPFWQSGKHLKETKDGIGTSGDGGISVHVYEPNSL